MNFFAHQDKARSQTFYLVFLFCLAIISLIILVEVVLILAVTANQGIPFSELTSIEGLERFIGINNLFFIALAIVTIVVIGYLYKSAQLASGGQAIAEAMGGRVININTRDADEKKILNVVEEMAIASGTPVPPIYVIEDFAINAFAAGRSTKDAVIGITRGAIRILDRDELQGVIAHEFSHIFNGDMKMNIRLISVLHGILVIGIIGYFLFRSATGGRHRYRSLGQSKNSGAIMAAGLALVVIGYTGTFFGNLIKAAVSRQREFLADASAIQFTRNPNGIGSALKKIGGYSIGSLMMEAEAKEVSHMLFGEGVRKGFTGFLATHPPLDERIKRIEPRWRGRYPDVALPVELMAKPEIIAATEKGPMGDKKTMAATVTAAAAASILNESRTVKPTMLASIGEPTEAHLQEARKLLTEIPDNLKDAAHEPFGSRAIVYCLLLDTSNEKTRTRQVKQLQMKADPSVYRATMELKENISSLHGRCRLPLLDLSIPALKQLSNQEKEKFKTNMLLLIKADYLIELMEWSLYRIVIQHLDPPKTSNKHVSIKAVAEDCQQLLSAVALTCGNSELESEALFKQGWQRLKLPEANLKTDALEDISILDKSLKRTNYIYPLKKPIVLKACCACLADNKDPVSIELIRAIGDGLDTPIPLMLDQQSFS